MRLVLTLMAILWMANVTLAASAPAGGTHSDLAAPAFSNDTKWTGGLTIGIAAMFIAAAVIGPIYRASMPEEPPVADAHGHDDHGHGHDDHGHDDHGHGGHH